MSGGSGQRFDRDNASTPKQYQLLGGRPLYAWALSTLVSHDGVDAIALVVAASLVDEIALSAVQYISGSSHKLSVTAGGATRQASVFNGLRHLAENCETDRFEIAIVHDAARPFLTAQMIDDVIKHTDEHQACTVGRAVADTVKLVDDDIIKETMDRSRLAVVQTPQSAPFKMLFEAHLRASSENWVTTDDAGIMERFGTPVKIVPGSPWNIKVTTREDLAMCELIAPAFLKHSVQT